MGDVNYTPRTWVSGEVVTAAEMNAEVKTLATGIQAAYTTFATTWTGTTTNPVIGNGSLNMRYVRIGKTLDVFLQVTMGSTTTYGSGAWQFALPTGPAFQHVAFIGTAFDTSAGTEYPLSATTGATGLITVKAWPSTAGLPFVNGGPTVPMTWATGDVLTLSTRLELP
jgi:hypothetical protein